MLQCLAYADDIVLISRSQQSLKEGFLSLQEATTNLGLKLNTEKMKYMLTGSKCKREDNGNW